MRPTRRLILASPFLLAACAERGPPVVLPFREVNDHLAVPVAFEGNPALALLDNGAPLTSLDQAFAASAGLRKAAVGAGLDPLDMRLGEAAVRIHPDLEDLSEAAIAADAPIAAIAGMEVFQTFVVALDFSAGRLTLHPRAGFRPRMGDMTLRLDRGSPPHPKVEIAINGAPPVGAYLDLGSSSALLVSPKLAKDLSLGQTCPISTRQVIMTKGGILTLGVSRLTSIERLDFAGQSLRDVPIDVLPDGVTPFEGLDAAIGAPLLRRFNLTLDLPRFLHLAPNERLATPFERRMTGLQTKPDREGLLIRYVADGSPARLQGFQPGERIIALDGAAPLMRTLRNASAGQTLEITLAGGERRRITGARYY